MSINMPYKFTHRPYQVEPWNAIMNPEFKRGILVWPRRNGKDLFSWNIIICKALQTRGLYFYIAPYYTQARSIIWLGMTNEGRRFLDYIPKELILSSQKQEMQLELSNGSIIKLHGSDNIDRIVGTNPYGIVFTEASLHKQNVWDYIRPILAANGGWALFNGTPRGVNAFYQHVEYAKKHPEWYYQYLNCELTGIPTQDAIQQDRDSGMPESLIQQEYYCSFTSSAEEVLIPLDIVTPCLNVTPNEQTVLNSPKIMGVDVAFAERGDQAVITKRQGPLVHPQEKHRGVDNMALATRVAKIAKEWRPVYICIDAGRGEGVISRLNQLGFGQQVISVDFGSKTFSRLCHRKKDEMWCRFKEWFHKYAACSLPDDEELVRDITAPTFKLNEVRKIQLESKEHMRSRGIKSTDCGDSVVLTFAEDFDDFEGMQEHQDNPEFLDTREADYFNPSPQIYDPLNYMDSVYDRHAAILPNQYPVRH